MLESCIVIPARYQSSRLPGKPLQELLGISMLRRTYHRCLQVFSREKVIVATDDQRIADHCREHGMTWEMTSETCLTGTDRVAEVATRIPADIFLNVQGDEPVINPDDITKVHEAAQERPDEIINGVTEVHDESLFRSPMVPKVVMREDGRLLYMSRAAVPTTKSGDFRKAWRQICIYAFPRKALEEFAGHRAKTPLEEIEDIEILRYLEMGYDVRMVPLSDDSIAVDTPEDIPRAEQAIKDRGLIYAG